MLWLILALLLVQQGDTTRDAVALGRTRDEALFDAFNRGYQLAVTSPVTRAEIITEFRRAVLIVRERASQGDYVIGTNELASAIAPYRGLVSFLVEVKLNPLNTYTKAPSYDIYIRTGPSTKPIAARSLKRDAIYPVGTIGPGNPILGVRIEATFERAEIEAAREPAVLVTDDTGNVIWQARVDLSRYR
jgi:hypothetical protein